MQTPESPLSAAPTAPSSPAYVQEFKLDQDKVHREVGPKAVQEIDYFAEAKKARLEIEEEQHENDLEDDGPPIVSTVFMQNGDVHFCRGHACKSLQLSADGSYVCQFSGVVAGVKTVREDTSTGRMTGSQNPDDNAGAVHYGPKVDAHALSVRAFEAGENAISSVDEQTLFVAQKKKRKRKGEASPKRGARCVDDKDENEHVAKATRRTADTTDQHALLIREAEVVMSKLVAHDKRADVEDKQADPKLADANYLFQAAAAKYLKTQQAAGATVSLPDLHDLAITAARVAAANRAKQQADRERSGRQALLLKPVVRQKVVTLCVTLWLAACQTTYMRECAKNTESFRPFISGVLYALKRGVELPTSERVVPACPELCEALPVLRGTEANSAAKSLHASSHCGLRTLHRSIASCSDAFAREHFASCIAQSKDIAADVASGRFDI